MEIRIGLFSDLHCAAERTEDAGNRSRSYSDMEKGLQYFQDMNIDFAISLGDLTHSSPDPIRQIELMRRILYRWYLCPFPLHTVFGNHDFSQLTLEQILTLWQTDRTYYSFVLHNIRFIFLDTNYTPAGEHYSLDMNHDWRYGIIDGKQKEWLTTLLRVPKRTFIFTHNNLYFDPNAKNSLWCKIMNHAEIIDILHESNCVEAVFQGHHHIDRHEYIHGIHFFNVPSPEKTEVFTTANFPILTITEKGFRYYEKNYTA